MDESKTKKQEAGTMVSRGKFWGTLLLAGILLLVSVYFLSYFSRQPGSAVTYLAVATFVASLGGAIVAAYLTSQHRQETGAEILFYTLFGIGFVNVLLFQGRTATATVSIGILSAMQVWWLLPRKTWVQRVLTIFGVLLLYWIIEWANPAWRIPVAAAKLGPIAAVIFGSVLVIVIALQVWREGSTLRNKLVVAFLLVTIIPLVIISYITYLSTSTALTNDANQKLAAAAQQTAREVDTFIEFNLEHVRAAGHYPVIVDYLTLSPSQRHNSPAEARALELITAMSREDPVFISSIAVFDLYGIDVLDTNPADIDTDKSDRRYFQNTMSSGLPYSSDVEHSATSGVPSIYFAAPVRNPAGEVLGIVRIRYAASVLQKLIIADTGLAGESSYAVLLDANHIRLAHGTDRDKLFRSIVPLNDTLVAELQSNGLLPAGTAQQLSTNLPDFEAGLENLVADSPFFTADTNGDGGPEQVAIAHLTVKDWSLAFAQSQDVFLSPITTQTLTNIWIAVVIAGLVAAAGFYFSQLLAGPIARLTQVAEAIAGGDINIQAKVETTDEIGILAQTFNRMTAQLRDFIVNLETRVEARTKDLATVAEVGTATSTILDTNRLLLEVVNLTKERFSLYHSHIYLLDEAGENLLLTAGAGDVGRIMVSEKRFIPLSREQSLVARAARERKGVIVNDVRAAPDFLPNPLLPDTRAELAVPMIVGDTLVGVFDIQSEQVGRFTDADVNIQTTLAAQVATSVQNARSYERSKAQAELETLVNEIGQRIQRTASMEEALQTAARELGVALGATRVKASIQVSSNEPTTES